MQTRLLCLSQRKLLFCPSFATYTHTSSPASLALSCAALTLLPRSSTPKLGHVLGGVAESLCLRFQERGRALLTRLACRPWARNLPRFFWASATAPGTSLFPSFGVLLACGRNESFCKTRSGVLWLLDWSRDPCADAGSCSLAAICFQPPLPGRGRGSKTQRGGGQPQEPGGRLLQRPRWRIRRVAATSGAVESRAASKTGGCRRLSATPTMTMKR